MTPRMVKKLLGLCAFLAAVAFPAYAQTAPTAGAPASAAPTAGEQGRVAAGFDVGASFPFEGVFDTGWAVDGSFDYFVARRFALRVSAGYARLSTDFADPFTRASLLGSAVYQLEFGALRPYGRVGIGVYVVSPPVGSTRSRVGAHFGGGVEWLFSARTALTGEALVHLLGSAEGQSTSSLDVTFGLRYYF